MLTPHLGFSFEETWHGYHPQSMGNALAFLDRKPMRLMNVEVLWEYRAVSVEIIRSLFNYRGYVSLRIDSFDTYLCAATLDKIEFSVATLSALCAGTATRWEDGSCVCRIT